MVMMAQAPSRDTHSLDSIRTIRQNVNLREEPFVVVNADDVVVLSGWMFDGVAARAPRVFARVGGADIPATSVRRDDVAAALGESARHTGFAVAVAIGAFTDRLLEIELVYEGSDGFRRPFDRCRVVVFDGSPAERSAAIVIEECQDLARQEPQRGEATFLLGGTLGVQGWGFAHAPDGTRYAAAAIVVGDRVYQAAYRIVRDRTPGAGATAVDIGYFAQIPSLRIGEGSFALRARLFAENGTSIESTREFRLRLDRSRT
jgi:hypothetical protein